MDDKKLHAKLLANVSDKQGAVNSEQINKNFTIDEMIQRAQHLDKEGRQKSAAHYYLYCLEKFRTTAPPEKIATCLHALSEICYKNEKYDDALKFRQAEKLLYESRLLQHVVEATVMKKREEGAADGDEDILNADPETPSSMYDEERRAMAYEKLGKMFLREKNLQMAKSYAMKAIEIRRNIQHAIEHPAEAEAKEYADLGREQYLETLKKYQSKMTLEEKLHAGIVAAATKPGAESESAAGEEEREGLSGEDALRKRATKEGNAALAKEAATKNHFPGGQLGAGTPGKDLFIGSKNEELKRYIICGVFLVVGVVGFIMRWT